MKVLSGLSIPSFAGNKSLISNGSDYITEGGATATEISLLSGVTSNIQTQLDSKLSISGKAADSELLDGIDSSRFVYGQNSSSSTNKSSIFGDIAKSGFYDSANSSDSPTPNTWTHIIHGAHTSNPGYWGFQLAANFGTGTGNSEGYFLRTKINNTWTSWKTIYHSGNLTNINQLAISDGVFSIAKTSGLQAALDGKASTSHAHAISNITSLQSVLDAKQDRLYKKVFAFAYGEDSAPGWIKLGTYTGDNQSRWTCTITGKQGWNDQNYPSQAILHGSTNYIYTDSGQIAAGCGWKELNGSSATCSDIALVRQSGYSSAKFDLYIKNNSNYVGWLVEFTSNLDNWVTNIQYKQADPGTGSNVFRPAKETIATNNSSPEFNKISTSHTSNADNVRLGDAAYIGSSNTADTVTVRSISNQGIGYVQFGIYGPWIGYNGNDFMISQTLKSSYDIYANAFHGKLVGTAKVDGISYNSAMTIDVNGAGGASLPTGAETGTMLVYAGQMNIQTDTITIPSGEALWYRSQSGGSNRVAGPSSISVNRQCITVIKFANEWRVNGLLYV